MRERDKLYIFHYSGGIEAYQKHDKCQVQIISRTPNVNEYGQLRRIRAEDGWTGHAFMHELEEVK